jgi:hypothetical protein
MGSGNPGITHNGGIMTTPTRPKVKTKDGWFAAGVEFRRALANLSDGAFKLFAHLSLQADRQTGCYEATQTDLAHLVSRAGS